MPLTAGSRLGPYEVLAPLGAGGMGEVYRARDTRLGRDVAVKVLPQHLSADAEVRARFEREAKTVSSLNHPHICTLFDVGREGDTDYLVMELVEGETLAQRLARGAMPAADVFRIGAQVADALDRAHRAGVVHRDLKPGNVMLTKGGAKLMDFGLARAAGATGPVSGSGATMGALSHSPTLVSPLTAQGTIVGTFQYMSPEQLEGREADARSDIWALGCVLYEMASGRRAFDGASQASLIAAIMNAQPRPLSEAGALASPALERLVKQCLARDPEDRWQSARDLARELGALAADSSVSGTVVRAPRRGVRVPERAVWAALLVAALAAGAFFAASRRSPPTGRTLSAILAAPGMSFVANSGPMTLSPDGRKLAFVAEDSTGTSSLWVRSLDETEPRPLPGTAGAEAPFWSPDGRDLGFFADNQLKRIGLAGGAPQVLAPAGNPEGASWGEDGFILFAASRSAGVQRIPAAGGEPVSVVDTSRTTTVRELAWPVVLPGHRRFLFNVNGSALYPGVKDGLYVAPLDGREKPRLLLAGAMNACYAEPGRLYFWRNGALWSQAFDANGGNLSGSAVQVADHIVLDPGRACGQFSASRSGELVYMQGISAGLSELAWVDRAGHDLDALTPPASYYCPRLSHDGRRVAMDKSDPVTDQGDIWIYDVARKLGDRVTSSPLNETAPVWSSDDSRLYWMSAVGASRTGDVHAQTLGRASREEKIFASAGQSRPSEVTPDGRTLLVVTRGVDIGSSRKLVMLSLADGKVTPWTTSGFSEGTGRVTRNGHWIAFTSDETGETEVYVQRFPEGGEKWRVSTAGGTSPVWRGDGRELYYVVKDRQMMSVSFRAEPTVEIGAPVLLFQAPLEPNFSQAQYDVSADGRRFLLDRLVQVKGRSAMVLDQGWTPPR